MNQLENCQARYRSNTWMGRTRTDGPDEFEPTKFDCSCSKVIRILTTGNIYMSPLLLHGNTNQYNINGLLCTYTEMFRIQTCCNYILSAAEGFRGQEATCADPGIFVSLI